MDTRTEHAALMARMICERCPVKRECLLDGLRIDEANGGAAYMVYGGLTPRQRKSLVRARNRVKCPVCSGKLIASEDDELAEICYTCGISWKKHRPSAGHFKPGHG